MAVLTVTSLTKELGGAVLFDDVSFKVERRDRLALSGPNGSGKTTLLRLIAGEIRPDSGRIVLDKGTRVALHDQRPPLNRGLTLREYVLSGASDLIALEEELKTLETAMAGGAHDATTMARYSEAQARLEHAGGYAWRDHAASVVRGLGFADADLDRSLNTFSGGELTRASLARSLGGDPDLILLDEPTNHLDVESLEWLERELTTIDAAVVLVAHDRWFLEAVTNATMELVAGRSTYFAGPWHAWRREKAERALHAQKTAARAAADIARLERFVERFRYKKSKAKQAQAKITHIGRLEKERGAATAEVALLTRRTRSLGFDFLKPPRSGRTVIEVKGLGVQAGDKPLLADATFALERGEHVALVGPNGSGKTTLLETMLERREATAGIGEDRPRRRHGVLLPARDRAGREPDRARDDAERDRPQPPRGAEPARQVPVQRLGDARAARRRAVRRRAATAGAGARGRIRSELPRPRRADEPPRSREPRGARGGARRVSRHGADRLARPGAARRRRPPHARRGGPRDQRPTRAAGPTTPRPAPTGSRPSPAEPKPKAEKAPKPVKPARPSRKLEQLEANIESQQKLVEKLEAKLAEDWTDVDTIAAHKRARDDLAALFERWEAMVDEVAG